jgi:hypothetical protein
MAIFTAVFENADTTTKVLATLGSLLVAKSVLQVSDLFTVYGE